MKEKEEKKEEKEKCIRQNTHMFGIVHVLYEALNKIYSLMEQIIVSSSFYFYLK